MAFPIPDHLPRRASPQDVSSKILSKIDQATNATLNSALASSWLNELDETIQTTKERIHERIQADLPNFQRQLEASKSVQARFLSLSSEADSLCGAVSNPETGLIPSLLEKLARHVALAQEAANASSKYEALSSLLDYRRQFTTLNALVQAGQLPDAVAACNKLEALMATAPSPLKEATIMADLQNKFRAAKNFTEDQLSDSYSRGIVFLPMELIITSMIQVRRSETVLSLTSIVASLSPQALSSHLSTLRRDLMSHFIDHVLTQPTSVLITPSTPFGHKLTLIPAPPNTEVRSSRLDALSQILEFLSIYLLTCLPLHDRITFSELLIKPLINSLLNNLVIPSLPWSFGLLPPFLSLLKSAVAFEEAFLRKTLGTNGNSQVIRTWADGVCGHYERQRRTNILEHARSITIAPEELNDKFPAELDVALEPFSATIVAIQNNDGSNNDSWGFDEDPDGATAEVEDGWGFDDEEQTESLPEHSVETVSLEPADTNGIEDSDPGEAWGWNDDDNLPPEEEIAEETAWDDPWAEPSPTDPEPAPVSITVTSPKVATRLEKLASKHKKDLNGHTTSLPTSPLLPSPTLPVATTNKVAEPAKRPANLTTTQSTKESYSVSKRTKQLLKIVEDVINEGQQFISSNLFATSETASIPGTIILQCASSALDLYNALYPVTFSKDLGTPERGLQLSNDYLYLCNQVEKIEQSISSKALEVVRERLSESSHHLKVLGDSWFDDAIEKERQAVDEIIVQGGQGFRYTSDPDRYDECESAMGQVVQEIRTFAQKVKKILPRSRYYIAVGFIVDAALSRILENVLELPDIPEVESHRLSELCRIFNALEGLFSEDPEQPSFVVAYVPSWLKYSYLSELLEASMADITYLFEEGALVDFEVDELVRLVRALFADTILRTNTINKILEGHLVSQ